MSKHQSIEFHFKRRKREPLLWLLLALAAGPFREGADTKETEGHVFDWDPEKQELANPEKTTSFYKRPSDELYGVNQD